MGNKRKATSDLNTITHFKRTTHVLYNKLFGMGKRQEGRENTLLQKDKGLSTSGLFHKSVPGDTYGNTQYVRQERRRQRERDAVFSIYLAHEFKVIDVCAYFEHRVK